MLTIDAKASEAYDDVRNDKTKTNWFTLEYTDGKDHLKVGKSGNNGLKECVGNFKQDQACFAYLRIIVGNDPLSQRAKFLLVSWCGEKVAIMRRGKMSGHIADVKKVILNCAVEDLDEKVVVGLLKKAMGANYSAQE